MRILFLVVLMTCMFLKVNAQTDTAFWFAVPEASAGHGDNPIYLRLTTQSTASTIKIYQPANSGFTPITLSLSANQVGSVDLTAYKDLLENVTGDVKAAKGLKIEASTAITAYFEEASGNNPEIYALKGQNSLGLLFYIPGQRTMDNGPYSPQPLNGFDIVATEDNTVVTITPTKDIVGHSAGIAFTVTLNKGETYSAQAASSLATGHLSGSKVSSTKPVAITLKDDSVKLSTCYDMGGDQLVPIEMLGQEYICVNGFLSATLTDKAEIMAVQNNTTVTINGTQTVVLNEGETYEKTFSGAPIYIKANKPVSVLHITGNGCELGYAVLPQIGCNGSNSVGITRADASTFNLILTVPTGAEGGFVFNGSTNVIKASAFQAVPNTTGWQYARVTISTGNLAAGASALVTNSLGKFNLGILYGDNSTGCSYGYFSNFSSVSPTLSYNNPVCNGSALQLQCNPGTTDPSVNFEWTGPNNFTSTAKNPTISNVSSINTGRYFCKVYSQGCFSILKFIDVTVLNSTISISGNTSLCVGNAISLTGSTSLTAPTYSWTGPNGYSSSTAAVNISNSTTAHSGSYNLTATQGGCTVTTSSQVTVNALPVAGITGSNTLCVNGTLSLTATNAGAGSGYSWAGPNGFTSTSNSISVSPVSSANAGSYNLTTTLNGCSANASTAVTVNALPVAVINGTTSVCANSTLSLTATDAGTGATYSWTGPSGFSAATAAINLNNVSSANGGNYVLTVTRNGCSTTTSATVTVKSLPVAVINGTTSICEDATLNLSAINAGAGSTYAWSGPNGFSANANSIAINNTTAVNGGAYTLSVSKAGCINTATSNVVIKALPLAEINGADNICEAATLSLTASNAGTGAIYSWSGPGFFSSNSSAVTINNVTTYDEGNYILLVNNNGCTNSTAITVIVKTLPVAGISGATTICERSVLSLTASDAGAGASYAWNGPLGFTGSGNTISVNNVDATNAGSYSLTVSKNGCNRIVSSTITVKSLPVASITGANSVCETSTLNLTATDAGVGATYAWNGPNSFSSTDANITISNGAAVNAGTYNLVVTKDGCVSNTSSVVTVKSLPIAAITGANSVCETSTLNLTATDAGVGSTYAWSGPNGFSSTNANITVNNIATISAGTYNLTVTKDGCISNTSSTVTVKSLPVAAITGTNSICQTSTLNLTATDAGVGATYAWNGPNSFSSTDANITISNVAAVNAGTYNLVVTKDGCVSNTSSTVTVKSLPVAAITGANSVCETSTLSLTATDAGVGATYSWNGPNSFSSANANITVNNIATISAGTYNLVVTKDGCVSNTSSVVTVKSLPVAAITGANSVCETSTLNLTATDAGVGATYAWSGPNGFSSTNSNISINNIAAVNAGTYNLIVTKDGCVSNTSSIVSVKSLPVAAITGANSVCEASTLNLTATDAGVGATYAWSGPNSFTSNNANISISTVAQINAGTYNLTVTKDGCVSNISSVVTVKSLPVAAITGTNSVCETSTLNLTATDAGVGATYAWGGPNGFSSTNSNISINNIAAVNAGTYNLIVTKDGCVSNTSSIVSVKSLPVAAITGANSVCETSTLNLTATDAGVGATYAWSGPNSFTSNNANISISTVAQINAGTYNLTVTKDGCVSNISSVVTVKSLPVAAITGTNSVCETSTLNLTATDAGVGATYAWNGPNSFSSANANISINTIAQINAGTYNLTVTKDGCVSSTSSIVSVKSLPSAAITGANSVCEASTLNLTATDAGVGATYAWSGPNSFSSANANISINTIAQINAGTYSLTVTKDGCVSNTSTTVTVKSLPVAAITGANSVCESSTLNLTATDAGAGATYAWSGPNSFSSINANISISTVAQVNAGTYNLTVTKDGCVSNTSTTVTVKSLPVAAITGANSVCETSTLDLTATDAGVGATYTWSGPNSFSSANANISINTIAQINAGTYSLTVTKDGCVSNTSTTVTVKSLPVAAITGANSVCETSTLNLTATDAGVGATYTWSGPNSFSSANANISINTIAQINAGTYNLTVTKDGCVSSTSSTVTVKSLPIAAITGANSVCETSTLSLTATDAGTGATYAWSGPDSFSLTNANISINNIAAVNAGTYNLIVTKDGCVSNTSTTVTVKSLPVAAITGANSVCETSTLNLTAADAGVGATYAWSGPNSFSSTNANITVNNIATISAGTYNLTVTKDGCISNTSSTVTVKSLPVAAITGANSICDTSTLNLSATDAGVGASYAWSGPNSFSSTNANISINTIAQINAGTYNLTVTKDGCVSNTSSVVTVKSLPVAAITGSNNICETSALNLTATDAGVGATYAWSGPNGFSSTNANITVNNIATISAGTYNLTVTKDGCVSNSSSVVTVKSLPVAAITGANSVCETSTLNLTATDAGVGATYAWSGPNSFTSNNANISISTVAQINAGTYNLTVTKDGCVSNISSVVTVKSLPVAAITGTNSVCETSTLNLTATDAGVGATYAWSGPNSFSSNNANISISTISQINAGTYNLTVTKDGCVSNTTTAVTVKSLPVAAITGANSICETSMLSLTATDAGVGSTYVWSGPNSFSSANANITVNNIASINAGTYNLTVTKDGCVSNTSSIVSVKSLPVAAITGANSVCESSTLNLTATDAGAGATYAWSGPNSFSSINANITVNNIATINAGTYNLTVTKDGCVSNTSSIVSVKSLPVAAITGANSVCETSTLNLTATDAGVGATYAWSGPNSFSLTNANISINNIAAVNAGTYNLIVTKDGCVSNTSTTVTVKSLPVAAITGANSVCETSTLNLTATDAGVGATYAWSGPNSFSSTNANITISNVAAVNAGTYNLVVTKDGCLSNTSSVVTVKSLPVAAITGTNSICETSTLTLTATDAGVGATYAWSGPNSFSSTNANITISNVAAVNAGTYNLVVTKDGCLSNTSSVVTVKSLPVAAITGANSVCETSTLDLTATDAGVGATYAWSGPNGFSSANANISINNIAAVNAGTYNLVVTKDGCISNTSSTVTVKSLPIAAITGSNNICETSTLNLTATDAGVGSTYAWSGPNSFSSANANITVNNIATISAGTYNLVVTKDGCVSSTSSTVTVKSLPVAAITGSNNICETSTLNLTATDAGVGATYAWSGPNSFSSANSNISINNIAAVNAGTYNLTVTKDGCVSNTSSTVTVKSLPIAAITGANSVCETSTLSLTATDAGTGATYAWSGPNSFSSANANISINNIAAVNAGTYNFTVTKDGCVSNTSSTVTVKSLPVAAITGANSVCETSTLSLTATDAGTGATYAWSGPNSFTSNNANISVNNIAAVNAGTYNLTVTRDGCVSNTSSVVTVKSLPVAAITGSNSVCETSTLNLTATDAGVGATYAWSGPNSFSSTNANISISTIAQINAGTYNLVVTKDGCVSNTSSVVTVKSLPVAAITGANSVCETSTLNLTATDAGVGATYAWSGSNSFSSNNANISINTIAQINAGTYNLTVTKDGCESNTNATVTIKSLPVAAIIGANSVCETSTLNLTATDAGTGATYAWSGPNSFTSNNANISVNNIAAVNAGTYNLVVTKDGCVSNSSSVVTVKSLPVAAINGANSICETTTLNLTATDAGVGSTYAWSGPNSFSSTNANITVNNIATISAGTYNLVVTKDGCVSNTSSVVTVKSLPVAAITGANSVCETSTLNLTATDAGVGATYSWSGPNSFSSANSNLSINNIAAVNAGTYNLTVTKNGCVSNTSSVVTVKSLPVAAITGSNSVCETSTLNLTATDAGTGATYAWSGPNGFSSANANISINTIAQVNAGTYNLTVTKDGCVSNSSSVVTVKSLPVAAINGANSICETTTLNLTATDAGVGSTYAWSGPNGFSSTNANITVNNIATISAGTYNLVVTKDGCVSNTSSVVTVKSLPVAAINGANSVCETSALNLIATDAGTGATYAWSGPNSFSSTNANLSISTIAQINAGTYNLVVTKDGCVSNTSSAVTVKALPVATITGANSVCETSTLNLTAKDAGTGATYAWSGPNSFSSTNANISISTIAQINAGTYNLVVNKDGCVSNTSSLVTVKSLPVAVITGANSVCETSTLSLTATDAGVGATYAWSGPNSFSSNNANISISNVPAVNAGTYNLTVTKDGCVSNTSSVVTVKSLPVVQVAGDSVLCESSIMKLSVTAIQPGVEYIWNGPSISDVVAAAIEKTNVKTEDAGIYSVKATKAGCSSVATFKLAINPLPVVTVDGKLQICEADTLFLQAKSANKANFEWTTAAGQVYNNGKLTIAGIKPSASGAYTLKAVSEAGCITVLTQKVKVLVLPSVAIDGKKILCANDSLLLKPSTLDMEADYKWTDPKGVTTKASSFKAAKMQQSNGGTYRLTAEKDGCINTDSIAVVINALPSAELKGATSICENAELQLETLDNTVNATWTFGPQVISKGNKLHLKNIHAENGGNYILTTEKNGCYNSSSFELKVKKVKAKAEGATVLCENDSLVLSASELGSDASVSWTGPGFNSKNPVTILQPVTPSQSGMYVLTVSKDGCTAMDSLLVKIKSKPQFTISGEQSVCEKAPVHIEAKSDEKASFQWIYPDGTISNKNAIDFPSGKINHSGNYKLIVKSNDCSAETIVPVKIKQLPNAKIAGDEVVCEGLSLQLLAEDAGTEAIYSWTMPGDVEVAGTSLKIAPVQLINSGLYKLKVTKDGCSSDVQRSLTVNPKPLLLVEGKTEICEKSELQLTAGDAGAGATYQWTLPGGKTIADRKLTLNDMVVNATGGYTLSVTREGCTVSSTANVFVKPVPVAAISSVDALCELENLTLKASSTNALTSFEWSGPATIATIGDQLNIDHVQAKHSGVYKLIARLDGCESVYTKNVKVKALPRPIIQGKNSICEGTDIDLYSVDAGKDAQFLWTSPTNVKSGNEHFIIPSVNMTATGLYKLKVTFDGCVSYDSVVVTVNKMPAVSIVPADAVCQYAPVFSVKSNELNGVAGKGIFSGAVITEKGEVRTGAAGDFLVSYIYTSNAGCVATANANVKIKPGITVNAGADLIQYEQEGVQLNAQVGGKYQQLTWTNIIGTTATILNPVVKPENSTTYMITVVNEYGCTAKDEVFVKVVRMKVPNAFSPNNDGINDKWVIEALKDYAGARVDIFNRLGQLVFSSKGGSFSWDGTINGNKAPEGTYYYIININDGKERKPLAGWVQILR